MQLVSIIISTYNGAKFIETQLQSIINQSYENLEIIIVDDASQDDTLEILNKIAKNHDHISVHPFSENLGYIKNFERGIALSNGNFIALSDQDDWWHETKIEKLVQHINTSDLIYCDSSFVDENLNPTGRSFSKIKHMIDSENPINFLIDNSVSGHAMLFKKSLFEKAKPFPPLIPHDWWLTYWASLNEGVVYFDEALIKYRHHQNNVIAANKHKKTKSEKRTERRNRLDYFYSASVTSQNKHQDTILKFKKSYNDFSFFTNINRVILFLNNRKDVLKIIKKSKFKKIIFCLNMFFKIK